MQSFLQTDSKTVAPFLHTFLTQVKRAPNSNSMEMEMMLVNLLALLLPLPLSFKSFINATGHWSLVSTSAAAAGLFMPAMCQVKVADAAKDDRLCTYFGCKWHASAFLSAGHWQFFVYVHLSFVCIFLHYNHPFIQ